MAGISSGEVSSIIVNSYLPPVYSIDASKETGRFGRLVNHSIMAANTVAKVVVVDQVPRLTLFALTDITAGEEILFDYGDRDPETRAALPWLCV